MGDPRELEWAKKPDALKESWTARIGTHAYTEFPLQWRVSTEETPPPSLVLSGKRGWRGCISSEGGDGGVVRKNPPSSRV